MYVYIEGERESPITTCGLLQDTVTCYPGLLGLPWRGSPPQRAIPLVLVDHERGDTAQEIVHVAFPIPGNSASGLWKYRLKRSSDFRSAPLSPRDLEGSGLTFRVALQRR